MSLILVISLTVAIALLQGYWRFVRGDHWLPLGETKFVVFCVGLMLTYVAVVLTDTMERCVD
ncbi:MAG: hypothetical protein LBR89_00875 [Holosporales bacterium]|jgi:hypothetical protein|nr:hypothetical protein [Holosporales bacterium]